MYTGTQKSDKKSRAYVLHKGSCARVFFVWNYVKLFSCCNRCNVRVYALIPVQEAFHIDLIANVQSFYGFVNIAVFVTEIRLYCESIGFAVKGNVEVKVISLRTGSIVIVKVSYIVSVSILSGSFYGHSLERYQLVLMIDQLVLTKKICYCLLYTSPSPRDS